MKNSKELLEIFLHLKELTTESYLVGGCVRDFLLSKTPHDFDIVTDASIEDMSEIFANAGWEVIEAGKKFLVLNISKNGQHFEIANFRKDGVYLDGRRPEKVEIGNIFEDAKRRDFSVNALYMDPFTGTILDPLSEGIKDIKTRTLKFIGKPVERIQEDHLRVFRFYRFLTKGFVADKKSLKACRTHFNTAHKESDPDRVRIEIEKMVGVVK